jgi:hypothetical protein
MDTYYTYGNADYNGLSADRFDTKEEAERDCIDRMKERKEAGFTVSDQAIIRVEWITIRDEFTTLKAQETKTTIETINKHYVED